MDDPVSLLKNDNFKYFSVYINTKEKKRYYEKNKSKEKG